MVNTEINPPPFLQKHQLNFEMDILGPEAPLEEQIKTRYLPGYRRIVLNDEARLRAFLWTEFNLGELETLAPRLWMMSKQSSSNISPLHRQLFKGREIIITEDPRMHLVWHYNRIFLKPLPKYLLSHKFWRDYLLPRPSPKDPDRETIRRAALGYLRTYFYLVRYESDFRISIDPKLCLIPEGVSWDAFSEFSKNLDQTLDSEVSLRYSYGEIRLTRLNFYAKIFLRKMSFQRADGQYGAYFARYYAPILFVLGIVAVLLNAMQVELASEQENMPIMMGSLSQVFRWFSILSLLAGLMLALWLASLFLLRFTKEWVYALEDRREKKKALQGVTTVLVSPV